LSEPAERKVAVCFGEVPVCVWRVSFWFLGTHLPAPPAVLPGWRACLVDRRGPRAGRSHRRVTSWP